MLKKELLTALSKVESLAKASKLERLMARPGNYLHGMWVRDVLKLTRKETQCQTFFEIPMHIALPSAMDIYITKGKSHDSEIRLARFLIQVLQEGDTFVDIGAHYGYFSLLASRLVGKPGEVHTFEAAPDTFRILQKNVIARENIFLQHKAASDMKEEITFYQFPPKYSEYNSMNVEQYKQESWYSENKPEAVRVEAVRLDSSLKVLNKEPKLIKIDVEGAELKVLKGMSEFLKSSDTKIIMEYILSDGDLHKAAAEYLRDLNFRAAIILPDGSLQEVEDIDQYMREQKIDSENVVFV